MSTGTRTQRRSATLTIAAPPKTVYDYISRRAGADLADHERARGRKSSTACEVIEAAPGRCFAFETGTQERKSMRWRYEFAPDGIGGTMVTESFEILQLPPHMAAAGTDARRDLVNELEDGMRQTLVRLKSVLEAPPYRQRMNR